MAPIITLITDFGLNDEYVGVMKGVILSRCPDARIVDLSHGIGRHDIQGAAQLLAASYRFFPAGTVHLVVVDPGVGGPRRIIMAQAGGQLFLAPDNGILAEIVAGPEGTACYMVDCPDFYLDPVSATFHGRDIMAPVAAALAGGLTPAAVGPEVSPASICRISSPELKIAVGRSTISGSVTHIDRFGNLTTNIHRAQVDELASIIGYETYGLRVEVAGFSVQGPVASYQTVANDDALVLFGSREYLEIAVNGGSASLRLGAGVGEQVSVIVMET